MSRYILGADSSTFLHNTYASMYDRISNIILTVYTYTDIAIPTPQSTLLRGELRRPP